MASKLLKIIQDQNRARIALALALAGGEAYLVEGVRNGAYDGTRVHVESEAWAMASMLLPRRVQG